MGVPVGTYGEVGNEDGGKRTPTVEIGDGEDFGSLGPEVGRYSPPLPCVGDILSLFLSGSAILYLNYLSDPPRSTVFNSAHNNFFFLANRIQIFDFEILNLRKQQKHQNLSCPTRKYASTFFGG